MDFDLQKMPQHVAIIMDGNGRWAKERGRLRVVGHRYGAQAVRKAVNFAALHQIKVLTLYAFSSENWNRPEAEVSALMKLFMRALRSDVKKLHQNNIKLKVIGDTSKFSWALQQQINESETLTSNNSRLILNIAANYGGQWDILQATQQLATKVQQGELSVADITADTFQHALTTADQPPVDLLIRTSGEQRISNFLLWQLAYAELYFSTVLWPDFDEACFTDAILAYQQRDRRFGGR